MEIKDELKNINTKIDSINDNVNQLILQSTKDDDSLELELTTLKTHIETLETKLENKDAESDKRINRILVIVGLVFSGVTIALNVLFRML